MSDTEQAVARHYTTADLLSRIRNGLAALGVDLENVTAADLKAGDEFHTGGVIATDHLFDQITLPPQSKVLDVGSGIGGTSRYLAEKFSCNVTGVDLTPDFVAVATALSEMVGMQGQTQFVAASALDMPVAEASFDLAVLMHVGMNIEDKSALFSQIAGKLKPGGHLALFEVMRGESDAPLAYPLPWSEVAETSFVASPTSYREAGAAAGLSLQVEADRGDFTKKFFHDSMARMKKEGPPVFGINLMMGDTAPLKFKNYLENVETGKISPVEMIFRKPE